MNHTDATPDLEPAAGYLDDEFARFRAERLARRAASKAAAATDGEPAQAPTQAPESQPGARSEPQGEAPPPPIAASPAPALRDEPEPAPAPVAAAAPEGPEPPDGYLEDEFARFRAERLRSSGRLSTRLAREAAAAPTAPTQEGEELFFGTTSVDRRRNKDRTEEAREDISDLPVARTGQAQAADHQPGPGAPRRRVG